MELLELPDWLGAAVAGALLAAIGYVVKLILQWVAEVMAQRRLRRARLVALYSLLRAGRRVFIVQSGHRNRLADSLLETQPETAARFEGQGYEELLTACYPAMTPEQRELHGIIRAITENTLRPINELLLQWVRDDDYFKGRMCAQGADADLAANLSQLEAHLLFWHAKYGMWIPNHPDHALVYLADEKQHGLGFPRRLEEITKIILSRSWLSGDQRCLDRLERVQAEAME